MQETETEREAIKVKKARKKKPTTLIQSYLHDQIERFESKVWEMNHLWKPSEDLKFMELCNKKEHEALVLERESFYRKIESQNSP